MDQDAKLTTQRTRTGHPLLWIAGAIIIAGVVLVALDVHVDTWSLSAWLAARLGV